MKLVPFRNASFESWSLGAVFGGLHLAIVALMVFVATPISDDAQWQLIFLPLAFVDLPILIVAYPAGLGVAHLFAALGIHLLSPEAVFNLAAHGIIGSTFYLLVPPALSSVRQRRRVV